MLIFSEMFDDLENEDEAFEDELELEIPGQNLTKESRRIFGSNKRGCCRSVRVTYITGHYNTGAHALLKNRIYKNFQKQWGNLNGSPYYRNGNYGIWNCGRGWYIGEIRYRGQCSGLAANNIRSQCPPRSSNRNWIYRNRGTWQNAGKSLVIVC